MLRAIALLEYVADRSTPPTFMEIVRALGVSKSTVHGLLSTLETVGWICRPSDGLGYSLGPGAEGLTRRRPPARELQEAAEPLMRELARQIGETVFLGVPDGDTVVVQLVVERGRGMGISSRPGMRLPLLAPAFGRVVLAALPPAEARRYLDTHEIPPFSERAPTDADSYMRGVASARKAGYAHDDEEFIPGARAIAVPIAYRSRVVALLWVAAFASGLPATAVESTAGSLLEAAQTIESLLEHD